MRESYLKWFKLFEEHKMSFERCKSECEILRELYARRNILVHNSGVVNDIYIKNIPQTQHQFGEKLYADEKYLDTAFESIKTLIFCTLIEGTRLKEDNRDEYIECIFKVAFDELTSENYRTCETVFYSLYKSPFVDEMTKHMALVNYWIAKIENSGLDSIKKEIETLDVSALDKIFLLAKHILLHEYQEANYCVEELYSKKELPFYALEEWPLFKRYRETDEYNAFKTNHPELTGVIALETKSENPMKNNEIKQTVKTELKDTTKETLDEDLK